MGSRFFEKHSAPGLEQFKHIVLKRVKSDGIEVTLVLTFDSVY